MVLFVYVPSVIVASSAASSAFCGGRRPMMTLMGSACVSSTSPRAMRSTLGPDLDQLRDGRGRELLDLLGRHAVEALQRDLLHLEAEIGLAPLHGRGLAHLPLVLLADLVVIEAEHSFLPAVLLRPAADLCIALLPAHSCHFYVRPHLFFCHRGFRIVGRTRAAICLARSQPG